MSDLQSLLERLKGATGPDLREQFARIINPLAYDLSAALDNAEGEPPELRANATAMRDGQIALARAKADRILALLQALIASKSPSEES